MSTPKSCQAWVLAGVPMGLRPLEETAPCCHRRRSRSRASHALLNRAVGGRFVHAETRRREHCRGALRAPAAPLLGIRSHIDSIRRRARAARPYKGCTESLRRRTHTGCPLRLRVSACNNTSHVPISSIAVSDFRQKTRTKILHHPPNPHSTTTHQASTNQSRFSHRTSKQRQPQ